MDVQPSRGQIWLANLNPTRGHEQAGHWEELGEDIDAVQLFRMTGPSAESEASIQRWLAKRSEQHTNLHAGVASLRLAETGKSYSASQVQQATE